MLLIFCMFILCSHLIVFVSLFECTRICQLIVLFASFSFSVLATIKLSPLDEKAYRAPLSFTEVVVYTPSIFYILLKLSAL